jgi:c(7)-type cytochrome triheme protein
MPRPASERGRRALGAAAAVLALVLLPVLALAIPASVRIPRGADHRSFAPAAQALFSHTAHQPLRCFACHPSLFPQAPLAFDHAAMDDGHFCGACHEGHRAPAISGYACERCHVPAR